MRIFLSAVLVTLATPAWAAEHTLEQRLAMLEQRLAARQAALNIAGMSYALVQGDRVVFARGFGHRNVSEDLPVTPDTLFAIGSTSKAFTSMLIAMLADDGKVDWDDRVQDHIPYFQLSKDSANSKVTIRDLLCHRTGYCRLSLLWHSSPSNRDQILRAVVNAKPTAAFRVLFQYNNVMYLAAGVASAHAAGTDWETLLDDRILSPLGMDRTTAALNVARADADASLGYEFENGEYKEVPLRDLENCAPAGAIYSSAAEMTRWIRFLLARGVFEDKRLVSEGRFDEMWEPQTIAERPSSYGLGWFLGQWNNMKVVEHGGNIDGMSAQVGLLPEKKLGFVLLSNIGQSSLQRESLAITWETMLAPLEEAKAANQGVTLGRPGPPWSASQLEPYVGDYEFPPAEGNAKLLVKNGKLCLRLPGQPQLLLSWPDEEGRWALPVAGEQVYVRFDVTDTGFVAALELHQGAKFSMPRIETNDPLPLTADELVALVTESSRGEAAPDTGPIRLSGTVHYVHQGLLGDVTVYIDGPDRLVQLYDFGEFGRSKLVYDDGRAWTSATGVPAVELVGAEAEEIWLQNPLSRITDWYDYFDSLEVVRKEMLKGREVFVVRAKRFEDGVVTRLVDAEKGTLMQERGLPSPLTLGGPVPISFSDYRDVGGIRLPFRATFEIVGHGKGIFQIESAELDAEIPEGLFFMDDL